MDQCKFKVGDEVKIKATSQYALDNDEWPDNPLDTKGIVVDSSHFGDDYILVRWPNILNANSYRTEDLKLWQNKKSHKHAELAKQWFDDPSIEIQYFEAVECEWIDISRPTSNENMEYRIKPETKPDFVQEKIAFLAGEHVYTSASSVTQKANVRFTFDGETGELKSVEKI